MNHNPELVLCPCGAYHPVGVLCPNPTSADEPGPDHDHEHERGCGGHDHAEEHDHDHDHGQAGSCGCSGEHAAAEALDPDLASQASATRAVYRIENMDCPVEEALIRRRLASVPGLTGLKFSLLQRVLTVDHELPSPEPIESALKSINMIPEPLGLGQGAEAGRSPQIKWGRLAVAGAFAAASELVELLHEWSAGPAWLASADWTVGGLPAGHWLALVLALAAIAVGGLTTYRKGWAAVKNFNLNINALMSVAVTGAVLIGHYPEAAMVMVLFNLAEALEAKSLDRARKAIKNLLDLAPETASIRSADGSWLETDIRRAQIGDLVRVKPGERVALDGVILEGSSALNQAPITGESLPVEKTAGDQVFAGTINQSGSFEFRVTAKASDSTLARIIHTVEEAQGSRAPVQRFVDRFASVYTPAVFLAALLTALIPPLLLGGVWTEWIYTALVILVIGCPCALVISTPVTIVSGLAAATRHGILVKGGAFLEMGRQLKFLALDKTGTLTHGRPRLADFTTPDEAGRERIFSLAASLAARSDHPVSRAIAEEAARQGLAAREVKDFQALPGQGVSGLIDGQKWFLGSPRLADSLGANSPELTEKIAEMEKDGRSVVVLAGAGESPGLFAVADSIRENSREAVAELRALGITTVMLTGDNRATARIIAGQAGVDDYQGELMPEGKLVAVEELGRRGPVGMVGDGINDAPALARADLGFAMAAAGTDTAIETADVALMDDDLRKIPRFIRLSKAAHAILVQNITLALGVKAVFLALTFAGQATMWMAVFADVGASLLVVANGLRAMRL